MSARLNQHYIKPALSRILLSFVMAVSPLLGLRIGVALGGALGRAVGASIGRLFSVNATIDRNMRHALPDLTAADRRAAIRTIWRGLGYHYLGEIFHYPRISNERAERIRLINPQYAPESGAIFFTGHFTNYELAMCGLHQRVSDFATIYRPSRTDFITRNILHRRAPFCPRNVPTGKEGAREMMQLLKQNIPLLFYIDHIVPNGVEIDFLGRPVSLAGAPTKLARSFNLPLVPLIIRRTPKGRDPSYFEVEFYPPITAQKTANLAADIRTTTQKMYDFIAERVRERPQEWYWVDNIWRRSPPPNTEKSV